MADSSSGTSIDFIPRMWGLVAVVCGVAVDLLFDHFHAYSKGYMASVFVGSFVIAGRVRWDLRDRLWFWILIGGLILIHGLLVFMIPWPRWHGPAIIIIAPTFFADYVAILASIFFVERRLAKRT